MPQIATLETGVQESGHGPFTLNIQDAKEYEALWNGSRRLSLVVSTLPPTAKFTVPSNLLKKAKKPVLFERHAVPCSYTCSAACRCSTAQGKAASRAV